MKVSIVCGVYNAEKYLEKCVNSMLNQTHKDIEIVLVVNASSDASESIVKRYEKNHPDIIKAYYTDEKLGAGGSRQFGLEHARGQYICFVDCDDMLTRDYIQNMVHVVCKAPENDIDIVISNFKKIDEHGKQLYVRRYKNKQAALVQSVAPWGKMFRRKYLDDNKMILRNIPFGEDVIFATEIYLTAPRVKLCDCAGYIWRDNPSSTSHTELKGFPENTFEKSKDYFSYMRDKYTKQDATINYFVYKYYIWYLLQSGRKVPASDMKKEYERIFRYLHQSALNYKKGRKMHMIKGERPIVKLVLEAVRILDRVNLSKPFFVFYSQSFLGYFWPSL